MYTVGAADKNGGNIFALLSDRQGRESLLPAVYQQLLLLAGLTGSYTALPLGYKDLETVIQRLGKLNIRAANIGAPFQEAIIPHLFALSEGAKIIGAVNAILRHGLYYKGYNTDAMALMDAMHTVGFNAGAATSVLVLGAGGAARAAAFLFRWLGVPGVTIAARDVEQAKKVAQHLGIARSISIAVLDDQAEAAEVIVNTIPVGVAERDGENPAASLLSSYRRFHEARFVVDFNADTKDNIGQELALRLGVPFLGGKRIMVHQARHALALWCGVLLPPEIEPDILALLG